MNGLGGFNADDGEEVEVIFDMAGQGECRVPPVKEPTMKQTKLKIKPEYYGLKINECELEKHGVTVLELVKKFGFETWVIGRDENLGKNGVPHYHIHFKSKKTIDALRKQKQVIMPNWGHSTKLGPPRSTFDNWACWAGYAIKERCIGMSDNITADEACEIDKNAHTQAVIKQSKLNWSQKQDDKKQEKKDLETRIYEIIDKEFLTKDAIDTIRLAGRYGECYFNEVGEMPPATTSKSKIWKWLYTRKKVTMEFYMMNTTDFKYIGTI